MARRIRSIKRKRHMGNRTFGAGNTKNRRGKGNRGGVGRAGWGKHRWFWKIKTEGTQTPKGFFNVSRRPAPTVGLEEIARGIERGAYPKGPDGLALVEAKGRKVLGDGRFPYKARVTALAFSEKAQKKIEAAGGQAVRAQ
jgi:large subunit ribosomal protein L15